MIRQIKFRLSEEEAEQVSAVLPAGTSIAAAAREAVLALARPKPAPAPAPDPLPNAGRGCIECGSLEPAASSNSPRCAKCMVWENIDACEDDGERRDCATQGCSNRFAPVQPTDKHCPAHFPGRMTPGHCRMCARDNAPLRWKAVPVCVPCLFNQRHRTVLLSRLNHSRTSRMWQPENAARRQANRRT